MATTVVSSKGQITLPADVRRRLSLHQGDRLAVDVREQDGEIVLRRLQTIEELADFLTSLIPPGTEPVTDVDAYYQAHRDERT